MKKGKRKSGNDNEVRLEMFIDQALEIRWKRRDGTFVMCDYRTFERVLDELSPSIVFALGAGDLAGARKE
jgi:hypothetical protein